MWPGRELGILAMFVLAVLLGIALCLAAQWAWRALIAEVSGGNRTMVTVLQDHLPRTRARRWNASACCGGSAIVARSALMART